MLAIPKRNNMARAYLTVVVLVYEVHSQERKKQEKRGQKIKKRITEVMAIKMNTTIQQPDA